MAAFVRAERLAEDKTREPDRRKCADNCAVDLIFDAVLQAGETSEAAAKSGFKRCRDFGTRRLAFLAINPRAPLVYKAVPRSVWHELVRGAEFGRRVLALGL